MTSINNILRFNNFLESSTAEQNLFIYTGDLIF